MARTLAAFNEVDRLELWEVGWKEYAGSSFSLVALRSFGGRLLVCSLCGMCRLSVLCFEIIYVPASLISIVNSFLGLWAVICYVLFLTFDFPSLQLLSVRDTHIMHLASWGILNPSSYIFSSLLLPLRLRFLPTFSSLSRPLHFVSFFLSFSRSLGKLRDTNTYPLYRFLFTNSPSSAVQYLWMTQMRAIIRIRSDSLRPQDSCSHPIHLHRQRGSACPHHLKHTES